MGDKQRESQGEQAVNGKCLKIAMPDNSFSLLSLQLESLFAVSQQELEVKSQELEETNLSLQTTQKALATTEKVGRLILVRQWVQGAFLYSPQCRIFLRLPERKTNPSF